MKKLILLVILAFSMVLSPLTTTMASTPKLINYQGKLKNLPAQSGTFLVVFEIFEDAAGGTALWIEQKNVTPSADGTFSAYLGETNPIDLKFDKQYYVQVTVGNNQPFPRTQLTSAPSAFYAADADTALYAFESGLAMDVAPSVLDWDNFTADAAMAGGDLMGNYPNPQIRPDAILDNIPDGSITTEMLSPNISTSPSGAAGGDMTGTYPDPLIAVGAVKTDRIADGAVTNEKIADMTIMDAKIIDLDAAKLFNLGALSGTVSVMTDATIDGDGTNAMPLGLADDAVTSAKILDGEVMTIDLMDAAVTNDKLADGAVTSTKILDGEVKTADLADGSVTTVKIADGAVTSTKILDGEVKTADLADGSVTEVKIADDAVSTVKIRDLAVTTAKINDAAVSTSKIQDAAVTNNKLADGAVTSTKILDGEVKTADLADGSVTEVKIADDAVSTLKIRDLAVTTAKINDAAVTTVKLADDAVTSNKIADGTIQPIDLNSTGQPQGQQLTSDGSGNVIWDDALGLPYSGSHDGTAIQDAFVINHSGAIDNGSVAVFTSGTSGNTEPAVEITKDVDPGAGAALAVSGIGVTGTNYIATFSNNNGVEGRTLLLTSNSPVLAAQITDPNGVPNSGDEYVTPDPTGTDLNDATLVVRNSNAAVSNQKLAIKTYGSIQANSTVQGTNLVAHGGQITLLNPTNGAVATLMPPTNVGDPLNITPAVDINGTSTVNGLNNIWESADGNLFPASTGTDRDVPTALAVSNSIGSIAAEPFITFQTDGGGLTNNRVFAVTANLTNTIGGADNSNATLDLSNTTVTAGSYGNGTGTSYSTFTVDAKGRLTAAATQAILVNDNGTADIDITGATSNNLDLQIRANAVTPAEVAPGNYDTDLTAGNYNLGNLDGTIIGAGTPATGAFTALTASSLGLTGDLDMQGNNINNVFTISNAGNAVLLADDFAVSGTVQAAGLVTAFAGATVTGSNLTVGSTTIDPGTGNTNVGGTVTAAGLVTANGGLTVVGSVSLDANEIDDAEVVNTLTIDGGQVDNTPVGAGGASTGAFTTLSASGLVSANGGLTVVGSVSLDANEIDDAEVVNTLTIDGGTVDNTPVGAGGASTGAFTTLTASSLVLTGDLDMQSNDINNVATISNAGGANVSLSDDFAVTGTTTSTGLVTASGGLTVVGSVSLDANEINDNEVVNTLTIDGGQVDNTPVGAGGASTGTFTTLSASSLGLTGDLDMQGNNIKNVATISNAGGANVSVSDDFAVTGTTTSLGIVNAFAGASVFGGNLTVGTTTIDPGTGNTNVGGTVTAAGLVTANGGATVTGSNLTVGSTTIAPGTGNTNVGGLLTQSSSTTSATAANVYFVTGNFDATTLVGFTAGSVIHIAFTDGAQYTITDANGASPSCNGGTVAYNGSNWYIVSTY